MDIDGHLKRIVRAARDELLAILGDSLPQETFLSIVEGRWRTLSSDQAEDEAHRLLDILLPGVRARLTEEVVSRLPEEEKRQVLAHLAADQKDSNRLLVKILTILLLNVLVAGLVDMASSELLEWVKRRKAEKREQPEPQVTAPTAPPPGSPLPTPTLTSSMTPTLTPNVTPSVTPTSTPSPTPTPSWITERYLPLPLDERWIEVNLTEQSLTAYEGTTAVLTSAISSGKGHTPTVLGKFRIQRKIESQFMAGPGYDLPNVPYVMYFYGNFALHGAYWHNKWGTPTSHGCVNINLEDARWLYEWAGPEVPPGAKSVKATKENLGTWVLIHK